MVRCAEFYERWKKDPNWCQKSPDTVNQIDHYLGLVNELENLGVETAAIYKKFPEGVARDILKIKDEVVRAGVIGNASGKIKRGDRVTSSDVKVWAGLEEKPKKLTPKSDVTDPTIVGSPSPDSEVKTEKPKKPGYVGCYQPGEVPVSDAPVIQPLKIEPDTLPAAQQAAKDLTVVKECRMVSTGEVHVNPGPAVMVDPTFYPDTLRETPAPIRAPCLSGAICTTGNIITDKVRGKCCKVLSTPLNQLPDYGTGIAECPITRRARLKGTAPEEFATAAGNPSPIKVLHELGGVKIVKTPLTDDEKKALADAFVDRVGRTPKEIQQIDELVNVRYERVSSRFELMDKALSWFLAQAEGE